MTFKVGLAIALASSILICSPSVAEENHQTYEKLVKKRQKLMREQQVIVDKFDNSAKNVTDKLGQGRVKNPPKGQNPSQRSGRK